MWVRGLKPKLIKKNLRVAKVAPHVGAWIETNTCYNFAHRLSVAPHVGAWIETLIEVSGSTNTSKSHPMWVRGLKLAKLDEWCVKYNVAPHVGAWIETNFYSATFVIRCVAPHVGAWIETHPPDYSLIGCEKSHPMWVRGLKHRLRLIKWNVACRTPCGCVD